MISFRDADTQAEFERTGYVVRRILSESEVLDARAELANTADGREFAHNDYEGSYYNSMFEREPAFQARFRTAMARIFHPKLDALLEHTRYFETAFLSKPAGSRELVLHQHVPLTERPFEPAIFCWCPLVDCDEESGTLMVVPGSHLTLRFLRTLETDEFFLDYREELTRRHAVPVRLKAGEAILFENSLLHGSYPNHGKSDRPVILTITMHEGARHVIYKHCSPGKAAVIDNSFPEIQCHTMMPGGPEEIPGQVIGELPAWDDKPTLEEFEELLRRGERANETFDPLEQLRTENSGFGRKIARRLAGWLA